MGTKLPEYLKPYFWDVDFEELTVETNSFFVVKRVLDRGNTQAVRWVITTYGVSKIADVVQSTRDLDVKTANFWTLILNLDPKKVPCLNKPYSPIHFGLYS